MKTHGEARNSERVSWKHGRVEATTMFATTARTIVRSTSWETALVATRGTTPLSYWILQGNEGEVEYVSTTLWGEDLRYCFLDSVESHLLDQLS